MARSPRLELLKGEKEQTRRGDELARQRRELPWVRIDKKYQFDTEERMRSSSCSRDGRNSLSTTSCLVLVTPPVVRPARRRPTASTEFSRTSRPVT